MNFLRLNHQEPDMCSPLKIINHLKCSSDSIEQSSKMTYRKITKIILKGFQQTRIHASDQVVCREETNGLDDFDLFYIHSRKRTSDARHGAAKRIHGDCLWVSGSTQS